MTIAFGIEYWIVGALDSFWVNWIVFLTSLYIYDVPCFMFVDHYLYYEQIYFLVNIINVFMLLAWC